MVFLWNDLKVAKKDKDLEQNLDQWNNLCLRLLGYVTKILEILHIYLHRSDVVAWSCSVKQSC